VGEAAARGAAGVIVHRRVGDGLPSLVVHDTTWALQDLGRAARRRIDGPVVAITGSSGKTTTRALMSLALSQLGPVHQTSENLNNHLGVPLTLLSAPEEARAAVVEAGTSAPGEIALLADIIRPDVRVVVNVGAAHLEELGGLDGVFREKSCLYRGARPSDLIIVNADDPRTGTWHGPGRIVRWGRDASADVRLLDVEVIAERLAVRARYAVAGRTHTVEIPSPSPFVAHNGGSAIATALGLGLDVERAVADLAGFAPVGLRMRAERAPSGAIVLNDSYNANPDSMRGSLDTLAGLGGRRVAVIGDMLELGATELALHIETLEYARRLNLDRLIVVGARMAAAAAALSDDVGATPVEVDPGGSWCVASLEPWLRREDRVLVKASRGTRLDLVAAALIGPGQTPTNGDH
jgi:UDP-N-acetylmuramoyl-tripeptide--D-alanyl-D-alanine ligase